MSFIFDVTSAGKEAIRPLSAEFGHVTEVTPTYGSFYGPDAVGVCSLFRNLVTWPRPRPLTGRFVVRTQ